MRIIIKAFGYWLAPASKRFYRSLMAPQQAQLAVQQRLINQLKKCEYGQHYQIQTAADWEKLPIVDYDTLKPWLKQSDTAQPVRSRLTSAPVLFHEVTSGSSGPRKQIPYTRRLLQSFNHLFCLWAYDLITHGPTFTTGKFYFSISPSFSKTKSAHKTTDDADYLSPWLRWLLRPFLVVAPPAETPEDFKCQLAQTLLLEKDLEIISIWSPSFLTAQLSYIQAHRERLYERLHKRMGEARSQFLRQPMIPWSQLWPQLKLISCWDSVTAADGAATLQAYFPNTFVQGKGLLATEAPMTLPLIAAQGQVPLLDDVYFEFLDSQGQCHPLHQLAIGQTYEVVISQLGGLYRYRMGDVIKTTHYFLNTPCLAFQGRGDTVSDLVGEKLTFQFVSDLLDKLDISNVSFQSLVAVQQPTPHYALLLENTLTGKERGCQLDAIATQLETGLCEAFHYRLARQLDQLDPSCVILSNNLAEQLATFQAQSGQRWGDIKHTKLGKTYPNLDFLKCDRSSGLKHTQWS